MKKPRRRLSLSRGTRELPKVIQLYPKVWLWNGRYRRVAMCSWYVLDIRCVNNVLDMFWRDSIRGDLCRLCLCYCLTGNASGLIWITLTPALFDLRSSNHPCFSRRRIWTDKWDAVFPVRDFKSSVSIIEIHFWRLSSKLVLSWMCLSMIFGRPLRQ